MTTASDALIRALEARGVDTVFGIPGVDNLAFYDALDRSSMRSILVRHEAAAGFAADAHFRVTGRPAVCFTTAGPGAANVVTPMAEAWASGSTFLHLTTALPTTYGPTKQPRGLPHFHPKQLDLFRPVAAAAAHVSDPRRLASEGARVLEAGLQPPHAAGYLQVPHDLLATLVPDDAPGLEPTKEQEQPVDTRLLLAAAGALGAAVRPIIWVGSGGMRAAASIIEASELLDAPIVLTHSAKRRWPDSGHPLVVALPPHEPTIAALIGTSDAILIVGSDLDAMMTRQFELELPTLRVQIDVARDHIGMRYPIDHPLVGPAELLVPALIEQLDGITKVKSDGARRALDARTVTRSGLDEAGRGELPGQFLDALDRLAPDDAIFVSDMAVAGYWAAGYVDLAPRRNLLYPIGWGTLGFGLPAAIGAAVAAPSRRVVCVSGDAGIQYHLAELGTAVQAGLSITLVIVDDGGYGMLRYAANDTFGREIASDLSGVDFAAVARGFGVPAFQSGLDDGWIEALEKGFSTKGVSVVHLRGRLVPPRMSVLWSTR